MDAYVEALRRSVNPDSVVVDIGCGTGIFSLLACQFGARKVYAIEPNDAIQIARESAKTSGYSDRIEFIQELSSRTSLPERADVIISDLRGVLPLFQHHIPSIIDARQRLLKPGGRMIPQKDDLWIVPVTDEENYRDYTVPWDDNSYGLNLQAAKRIVTNNWRKAEMSSEQFLAVPQCWGELDYTTIASTDIKASINWIADKTGEFHGFCAWFDATLMNNLQFSNQPGKTTPIYGQAFFPLAEAASLVQGDTIELSLHAKLTGDDYTWNWSTLVLELSNSDVEKASFKQSTFFGEPLSLEQLARKGSSYKPILNHEGKMTQSVLAAMDSNTPLDEIARELLVKFPDYFSNHEDALVYAGDLSLRFSR